MTTNTFKQTLFSSALSGCYIGLSSTEPTATGTNVTEPSGDGYSRQALSMTYSLSSGTGTLNNSSEITFTNTSGSTSWLSGNAVAYYVIYSAQTGGNLYAWGNIDPTKVIQAGDTAKIAANGLVITLADLTA